MTWPGLDHPDTAYRYHFLALFILNIFFPNLLWKCLDNESKNEPFCIFILLEGTGKFIGLTK